MTVKCRRYKNAVFSSWKADVSVKETDFHVHWGVRFGISDAEM